MKEGKFKNSFLFIVGISLVVIILFIVGFVIFYKDSSSVFGSSGYIINATENSSDSYSFASGTKYKTNLSQDIEFSDVNNKTVSVDSASFVHYDDGSISFLQNGALLDLDEIDEDYVPFYNISDQFIIQFENGEYSITNGTKSLAFTNWVGRISDSKYIVVGQNLSIKIPGVSKAIEGDYFELLFMTDGVVKIDNQDVSYQVTAQGSVIYVGDSIQIDLGEGQISYGDDVKLLLSQITISGDENIDIGDDGDGTETGTGSGDGSLSSVSSGTSVVGSGTVTDTDSSGVMTSETDALGSGTGNGDSENGDDDSTGGDGTLGNGSGGENTTVAATVELIKIDVTATSMYATLQMNRSSLITGSLKAYLTNISTGERSEVGISKEDGTFFVCSSGTDCYSFGITLLPDSQYLLSIVDADQNKQYFQKLITTSELGVQLEKKYVTSSSLSYHVEFSTNTSVSQLDFYLYDPTGGEFFSQVGIADSLDVTISGLKPNTSYTAVIKNVSVCDESGNCIYDEEYEVSRVDVTLKKAPTISSISVKKNVDSATFDLSATIVDEYSTVTKYIYTVCKSISLDSDEDDQCFTKEKSDPDALSIKVGEDVDSGVTYIYTFKLQYHDGQMERELIYNGSSLFSMESLPYFQLTDKEVTSNSITGTLSLVDPSCTVPIQGRVCRNASNTFTLRYYKLVDGEEKKTDLTLTRSDFKYDSSTGLYYYDLSLSNLAAETKYVIKVYGTYVLNDEEYSNVQIGDEIYVETSSTGNLKFVYTANDSSSDAIINYNARLSGGVSEDEDSSSALDSIAKLTFDLYAGSYVDDSETNNRHLGSTVVVTGNSNIRKSFCNTDVTSDTCNTSYNFTNMRFGIDSLADLMKATGSLSNFCSTVESFGCLGTTYTVVVKGYDSAGNAIEIDNNTYTYSVTPSYYVTVQLDYHASTKSIAVDQLLKSQFKSGSTYDFSDILKQMDGKLKNEETYASQLDSISDSTTVGIQIYASIPQNYINAVYNYDKVVTNYYICSYGEDDCNEDTAIYSYSVSNTNYTDSSHIFYLDDSKFVRGNAYQVMYELVFTASDGTESVYSNSYTTKNISIYRQAPIYYFYIVSSTSNTITYSYNIKDVDGAIDTGEYYFYYVLGDDKTKVQGDSYTLGETRQVTFTICESDCNNVDYSIYLKEKLLGDTTGYVSIESTVFDGEYEESTTDEFELFTYSSDNRLYIQLNDDDLADRTALYRVRLYDTSSSVIYDQYYLASRIESCSSSDDSNSSTVCEKNPGDYSYLTVDYANSMVAANIGKTITVSVDSYYDSGLVGIRQTFEEGLIFQNVAKSRYLNIYGYSKNGSKSVTDVEEEVVNGVYMIDGGNVFGSSNVIVYHKLGLASLASYSVSDGASVYSGNTYLINKEYVITYLQGGGIKVGNYSGYNPKVVSTSSLSSVDNSFQFDSIIPKVSTKETRGINSLTIDFSFTSVTIDTLNSQFKKESGKYYLYVNLYDKSGNVIETDQKVAIDLENGTSIEFKDLSVKTDYKYDIWVYMKNGSSYEKVQVYDGDYIDYVKTTYETSTLSEEELLSKVIFKVQPTAYNNNGDSISDKTVYYNVQVTNGSYLKIRLALYNSSGSLINFDGTTCTVKSSCYLEISDESYSIDSMSKVIREYIFNNNTFVFGDDYYTLKVFAIPYYSSSGYDTSKMLTLYNDVLVSQDSDTALIDVHELSQASFTVNNFESGYDSTNGYYISFDVGSITDDDYVMKNGEYHITLYDDAGDAVYTVVNSNGKTVLVSSSTSATTALYDKELLYSNNVNVSILFPNLVNNSQYAIELSYDTYRNNVSFGDDETKKTAVSPYTDYIYTPITEGITLGNVVISKASDTSFKLEYIGSNNLSHIKRVDYKVNLRGSSYSTSGNVTGNSIFTKSGDNYILSVNLTSSENSTFDFSTKGTYTVSITYYTDTDGTEKVHSSTFSIIV